MIPMAAATHYSGILMNIIAVSIRASVIAKPNTTEFTKENAKLFTTKTRMMKFHLNWNLDVFTIWKNMCEQYFELN